MLTAAMFERGYLPVRAALHPDGLYLALRKIHADALQDPLLQHTIRRVSAEEKIHHVPWSDVGKPASGTHPAGLLFHVGRCGSTLLGQALRNSGAFVVYAEPPPINDLLAVSRPWTRQELKAALSSLGAAFAAHSGISYVLKFSSWNTLYCDVLAEAFPETPWIFNIRDPVEVGVALARDPPPWFRRETDIARRIAHLADPEGRAGSEEQFAALVYGAFCTAISKLDPRRGKLVPYEALPSAAWETAAPHFGLSATREQRERMAAGAANYAKAPVGKSRSFVADTAFKQSMASAELRHAIDAFARPPLERLLRSFQAP
jgi:hypothetical protein